MRSDLDALMSDVLSLRGVTAVALLDAGGAMRASVAAGDAGFEGAGALLASALAASGVIGGFVGGQLQQTVIEYRGGPVVLAPVPTRLPPPVGDGTVAAGAVGDDAKAGMVLAVRLESLSDLGRLRFHLPRVLRLVALATTSADG